METRTDTFTNVAPGTYQIRIALNNFNNVDATFADVTAIPSHRALFFASLEDLPSHLVAAANSAGIITHSCCSHESSIFLLKPHERLSVQGDQVRGNKD